MTTRRTSAACFGNGKIERNFPLTKTVTILQDQLRQVCRVWIMANTTRTTFAIVDDVHVVQVPVAVAEAGIQSSIGEPEKVLFMTAQASPVDPVLVGGVDFSGIVSPEHTEVIRTVRIMACLAFTLIYWSMKKFFPGEIPFNISQGGGTKPVLTVAAQACGHFVKGKKCLVLGIVCRVTGTAASLLQERLVRIFHS